MGVASMFIYMVKEFGDNSKLPIDIEELKPLNPDKIILFGSYAYGTPTEVCYVNSVLHFLIKSL